MRVWNLLVDPIQSSRLFYNPQVLNKAYSLYAVLQSFTE